MMNIKKVLVTGGAGYVGSALVPKLLDDGYQVNVLDLYLYGDIFGAHRQNSNLGQYRGDIRDETLVQQALAGCDAVIHLACISNDPSYDLNPALGKSINFDAFRPLVRASKDAGAGRFIYASSSSVYGIKSESEVTENLPLEPLTDYSKYKAMCEEVLEKERESGFDVVSIRPSTVCGYAPRLRLDLTVNILTNHAITDGVMTVFGGDQMRPNIHISDMVNLYRDLLKMPGKQVDGGVFNAGYENLAVISIAELVRDTLGLNTQIKITPTNDNRSYHVSSALIKEKLGFSARYTVEDAVRDLQSAFGRGLVPNSKIDSIYFNIKRMQECNLT